MILTEDQQDVLTELVNIGVGRAAASLSELVGKRIELRVPRLVICDSETLASYLEADGEQLHTVLCQLFHGAVSGRACLAFPMSSSLKLGQILGDLDSLPDELDLDLTGILTEVANIVLNGVLGSISNMLESSLSYSVPELSIGRRITDMLDTTCAESERPPATIIYADTRFEVAESKINGSLVIIFELGELESALETLASPV